jgi:hypothetical protein
LESQELVAVEARIRAILGAAGLQWIVDSVDEAISAGVTGEKGIVVRKGRGLTLFGNEGDVVAEVVEPGSRQRPQRIVATNEPVIQQDRVEFFIAALRRAVGELPEIQEESVKILSLTTDQSTADIGSIQFRPDEDAPVQEPPRLADLVDVGTQQLRLEALRVLEELDAELGR